MGRGTGDVFWVSLMVPGRNTAGRSREGGLQAGQGLPEVPVTQEEAKVRSVRKEEEEEKDFRGKEKQKNTLTLLSCSLGR